MRAALLAFVLLGACDAPPPASPVAAPLASAAPAPPPEPSASASAPAPPPSPPDCAVTSIELPANTPPCAPPGAVDLANLTGGDLLVDVTPSSARVKPGASIDFTFTMTNHSQSKLHLVLAEPQEPSLQVLDPKDNVIEPLPGAPPVKPNAACAHVDCPLLPAPPGPVRRFMEITLAPGGVARTHLTWRARKLAWPKVAVAVGCCETDGRTPLDAGPLPAGSYRLQFYPPVSPGDSGLALQHDEAQIDVAP